MADTSTKKYLSDNSLSYLLGLLKTEFNKKAAKDTATKDTAGLMSTSDKSKLDGIDIGANKYTLPTATKTALGGVRAGDQSVATVDSSYTPVPIVDGVPYYKDTNTTYSVASASNTGLMTASNFTKLTNISKGAQVNVIETVQTNGTALGITDKAVDIPTEFALNWATKALTQGSTSKTIDDLKAAIIINPGLNLKVTSYTEDETFSLSYSGCGRNAGSLKFEGIVYEESHVAIPHALCVEYYDGWSSSSIALEENVITTIKVNNTEQDVKNKTVNITVPTYSPATQDRNGLLSSDDKKIIDNLGNTYAKKGETITYDGPYASLDALKTAHSTGTAGTIYLVSNSGTAPNVYDEYVWVAPTGKTAGYELIGTTAVDLSDYLKKTDELTTDEVKTIWTNATPVE